MSLQIVQGKPGSGKSYHTVTMLLQYLEDWSTFEDREGRSFDRVLYTNLPLNTEAINEYLSKKTGKETEIGHYVKPIDENVRQQFVNSGGKFPLSILPQNSMIVIDEVQKMFGAEMGADRSNKQFNTDFRNYISQHRHYGHDLIFITQSTENIAKPIVAMAEKLFQVENVKNFSFPFPINIPFSDLDVVKEAFGIRNQFYRVSVGKYQGRRVKFDGEATSHLMNQAVFACYSSHTLSDVTSDRPSLHLTKVGSILWLAKKHAWHLGMKVGVCVFALIVAYQVFLRMPEIISSAVKYNTGGVQSPTFSELSKANNVTTPDMTPVGRPLGTPPPFLSGTCTDPDCTHPHGLIYQPPKPNEKIKAIFPLGVITDNGRRKIGQMVNIDGVEEVIQSCNVRLGVVVMESGKEIMVPK